MEYRKKSRIEETPVEVNPDVIRRKIQTIYSTLLQSSQDDDNTSILRDILLFLQTNNQTDFDYDSVRSSQLREYCKDLIDKAEIYKNNSIYNAIIRAYNNGSLCTGYYGAVKNGGKKSRRQKSKKSRRFKRSQKMRYNRINI
jgi:hypothetical protein